MKHALFILLLSTAAISCATKPAKKEATVSSSHIEVKGIHHIGLAVKDLGETSRFFIEALGYKNVGGKPDYPSIFVSNGNMFITLWQVPNPETAIPFNRKTNIGLHHMAFELGSFEDLDAMYEHVKKWPGVTIDFSPELMGAGPAKHMMFREPGGIRLEFVHKP